MEPGIQTSVFAAHVLLLWSHDNYDQVQIENLRQ